MSPIESADLTPVDEAKSVVNCKGCPAEEQERGRDIFMCMSIFETEKCKVKQVPDEQAPVEDDGPGLASLWEDA